ncbi:hypothetical protein CJ030_MR7G017736 [Morella rubra]|uniref:Uncharacterized protein n=1 Tax=Morella rubra TaxID=262757 RepID=A0A6A1V524_9ROSI|nr:hypothetical protein CJ030_MR7G017736 [Morella rubra]
MNSMFSSFDGLFAEILGQAVRTSFPSLNNGRGNTITCTRSSSSQPQHDAGVINKVETSDVNKKQQGVGKEQQRRAPRFALEFDGLNCCETLVSR